MSIVINRLPSAPKKDIPEREKCRKCNGTGVRTPRRFTYDCKYCKGTGRKSVKMITGYQEVAGYFGLFVADESLISRQLYNATECGAWLKFVDNGIMIGTIVEGSDAEPEAITLNFPFSADDLGQAIQKLEEDADEIWNEASGDDYGYAEQKNFD